MTYCFSTIVDLSFEEAVARVTDELQKEGFGVLTEIDTMLPRNVIVQETDGGVEVAAVDPIASMASV